MSSDPCTVFRSMEDRGIGTRHALFWAAWGMCAGNTGDIAGAAQIFKCGRDCGAEPASVLEECRAAFQGWLERRLRQPTTSGGGGGGGGESGGSNSSRGGCGAGSSNGEDGSEGVACGGASGGGGGSGKGRSGRLGATEKSGATSCAGSRCRTDRKPDGCSKPAIFKDAGSDKSDMENNGTAALRSPLRLGQTPQPQCGRRGSGHRNNYADAHSLSVDSITFDML
ncbi:unnamed protein product, partial [Phaeothamnion confervicola]